MALQVDGFNAIQSGGAGEGAMDAPAAGSLSKILFFVGTFVVTLGLGGMGKPPRGLQSHNLLTAFYCISLVALILFGMWMIILSFMVAENPHRRSLAKAVMWATSVPLLLFIALYVIANTNMGI